MIDSKKISFCLKHIEIIKNEISINRLHPKVIKFLKNNISHPWLIACSGGPDSLMLLILIYAYFPSNRNFIHVAHYNHKTRKEESDFEAKFVQFITNILNIKLHLGESKINFIENISENNLRTERHNFFKKVLSSIKAHYLILGHQQNDIAETILMRIARGSSIDGLIAPRPIYAFSKGKIHLRPLLNISHQEIVKVLQKIKISFCQDSSNTSQKYFRNRIRHAVLPIYQKNSTPQILKNISFSRKLLEEDAQAIDIWLEELLPNRKCKYLNLLPIKGKPIAIYRRALRDWLACFRLLNFINQRAFTELLENIVNNKKTKCSAGNNCFIRYSDNLLFLEEKNSNYKITFNQQKLFFNQPLALSTGDIVEATIFKCTNDLLKKVVHEKKYLHNIAYINFDFLFNYCKLSLPNFKKYPFVIVRPWLPGDRYRPFNFNGHKKLKNLFTEKNISIAKRHKLPIFIIDTKIIWIPGLPIAHDFQINNKINQALRLTYASS